MPTLESPRHRRRSIRLNGYDYTQAGAYFIIIVAQGRQNFFARIVDGESLLNVAGNMLEHWWCELPHKFPSVDIDEYVIMPNHFHSVIMIGSGPGANANPALSDIVQWFKTMTTNAYIQGVKQSGWPPFAGKLWQRNYYDHIIRNETNLENTRNYILQNPTSWETDDENPLR